MDNNFDREFMTSKTPYKPVIKANPDFLKELQTQYEEAETKPSFHLYLAQFYNENEVNKGFDNARNTYVIQSEFETQVNNHYQEFSKIPKRELSPEFYCPDITQTPIYKALTKIKDELILLQKSAFNDTTDKYKESKLRANNVSEQLPKLRQFTGLMLDEIKADNGNPYLFTKDANNKQIDLWQTIKSNFNSYLNPAEPQHLTEVETTTATEQETDLTKAIKYHLDFFSKNCPRKNKQILKDEDFEKLINWTVYFYENDFEVPEISKPIKTVNTNSTWVQLAFRYLFNELHPNANYPETLFEFYRLAFKPYSEQKKSNFYKVANKDEVKTLMKIDN